MYQGRRKNRILPWVIIPLVIVLAFLLIKGLSNILTPFVIAAILAYILNPIVTRITARGVKRAVASMVVMFVCFAMVLTMILIIVPMLFNQLDALFEHMPAVISFVKDQVIPWINAKTGSSYALDSNTLTHFLQNNAQTLRSGLQEIMPSVAQSGSRLITVLVNLFMLPFLLYYFLLDWSQWEEKVARMIPRRWLPKVTSVAKELDAVLSEFLRGQLLVMIIMGFVYGTGLALTGLNSGFAIGMLAGLLVFIPYLGAFTGVALATLAAFLQFDSYLSVLWVWSVFAIGQPLESFFLTPQLVGERIGLSPLAVIFALMAFGELMGFVGILLALPLAAICLVLAREVLNVYYGTHFYLKKRKNV
ncbi:AI-2E family transporter [Neisseria sp. Ec49-e6-T10]|uniref:AI-2E family transporter n=1 Tax=Neisseria sp. Ec49-e6-T10 TaxID=3140744 RepID=UPI003EBBB9CA